MTVGDASAVREDAAARWGRLVGQQRESGLSVNAFCAAHGLTASSLFAWRRKLMHPPADFKAVKIIDQPVHACLGAAEGSFITLCLSGGKRLRVRRGFDRQLLLDLLDGTRGAREKRS